MEPLAVCVRATKRMEPIADAPVVIFGDGPIGLLTLLLLQAKGFREVMVIGGEPERLAIASRLAIATATYRRPDDELQSLINERVGTAWRNVIEVSGASGALEILLKISPKQSKILLVGDYKESQAAFPWNRILHHELSLIGSNASAGGWAEAVQYATSGTLPLERLISQVIPAKSFESGITATRKKGAHLKTIMT